MTAARRPARSRPAAEGAAPASRYQARSDRPPGEVAALPSNVTPGALTRRHAPSVGRRAAKRRQRAEASS
jgi:hypothetical protein